MRRRTKVMLSIAAVFLLACGVGLGLYLGMAATTLNFDIILTSSVVALGFIVTATTVAVITQNIKKRLLKSQTEKAAQLLETKLSKNPVGVNVKVVSDELMDVNERLINGHNVFGAIKDNGYTKGAERARSKIEIFDERIKNGNLSEKDVKKLRRKEKNIQNVIDTSAQIESNADLGRYAYKSTIGNNIVDERNQISCMTSETCASFAKFIESESAIKNRVSKKDRNSYGYSVSLNFNGSNVKKTYARSNSGENMEMCEYMLLSEAKNELEKNDAITDVVFPIMVKRKHFTKESGGKGTQLIIVDKSELDTRVETLGTYLKKPDQFKYNKDKDYVVRKYEPRYIDPEDIYNF